MRTRCWTRWVPSCLAIAAALLAFPGTAKAADWKFSVTPYFWAADISLDAKVNGNPVLAADVDVSDLMDKLDMAFFAHTEMYTDKGGFFFDGSWMQLSSGDTRSGGGLASGTRVDTDLSLGTYELGAFYHPTKPGTGFDVLFGIRVISLSQDIDFELQNGNETGTTTDSSLTDAFVGLRAGGPLGGNWDLMVRGDVGTGDTELTWNALGTVGFHFGSKGQFGARFGWRQMTIHQKDTGSQTTVESTITMKGPLAGLTLTF